MQRLLTSIQQNTAQPKPTASLSTSGHITPREAEILVLMAEGAINKQIASRLGISVETVKKHLRNVYLKIGAQNKIEALNKTRWLGLSLTTNQY